MDYLIPGLLGFLTGALFFGLSYQQVFVPISKLANLGSVTVGQLFQVNSGLLVSLFLLLYFIFIYLVEKNGL